MGPAAGTFDGLDEEGRGLVRRRPEVAVGQLCELLGRRFRDAKSQALSAFCPVHPLREAQTARTEKGVETGLLFEEQTERRARLADSGREASAQSAQVIRGHPDRAVQAAEHGGDVC